MEPWRVVKGMNIKMKKIPKNVLSIFTMLTVLISLSTPVSAYSNSQSEVQTGTIKSPGLYMSSNSKTAFAAQKDKQPIDLAARSTVTADDIDMLLGKAVNAQGAEREAIFDQLEKYGVYEYEGIVLDTPSPQSESKDVTMSVPIVAYDALERTWSVTCGGYWKNSGYLDGKILPDDVGGEDGFGVGYTQTNDYDSYVVRTSASLSNRGSGSTYDSKITYNRSDGDGSKGFGFRMQDYLYWNYPETGSLDYMGKEWHGTCTYDSTFGTFSGIATGYYIHTYDKCEISSVTFGINGNVAGISVEVSQSNKSFSAYSADKKFGV